MPITLCSSDNQEFGVDEKVATQSGLVDTFLANNDGTDITIPLPQVDGKILKKIIEFCEHHKDDDDPCEAFDELPRRSDDIDAWDSQYIQTDQATLFELVIAANYMDVKSLLDLGCKAISNLVRHKNSAEIREMFNIVDDFTEEERAQIEKENMYSE